MPRSTSYTNADGLTIGSGRRTAEADAKTLTASANAEVGDANGDVITCDSADVVTVTILNDATVRWPEASVIVLYQAGVGVPVFAAGSGVTLRNPASVVAAQYKFLAVQKVAANSWAIVA
jgi:hypothetical protein